MAIQQVERLGRKNCGQSMKLLVVICHFQEHLEWTKELKHSFVVYNKNPLHIDRFEHNFPNTGYDSMAYLNYIIENYNNLPEFVCFTQDNPFVHYPPFLKKVNDFDFSVEFIPLGISYIRDNPDIIGKVVKYAEINGIPYTLPIKFSAGHQYIISKKLILKNSLDFYRRILNTLSKTEIKTDLNYTLEYLWPTLFHFNDELVVSRNGC